MKLFVDDWRPIPNDEWEVARTVTDAIRILSEENVEIISLDHDIQDDFPSARMYSREDFTAVARYLVAMKKEDRPEVVFIHSANHYGSVNLKKILSKTYLRIVRISPVGYKQEIEEFLESRACLNRGK